MILAARASGLKHIFRNPIGMAIQTSFWFGSNLQKLDFMCFFFAVQTFNNQSGYNLDMPKTDLAGSLNKA